MTGGALYKRGWDSDVQEFGKPDKLDVFISGSREYGNNEGFN